ATFSKFPVCWSNHPRLPFAQHTPHRLRQRLTVLQRNHLCTAAFNELRKLGWTASEDWERVEMHGNHKFRLQQFAGICRLARRHGEKVADGEHHQLRCVELVDNSHIAE